jgi:ATP-dependent Lon protease
MEFCCGVKSILIPVSGITDTPSVHGELFVKFKTGFYSDPLDAVCNAGNGLREVRAV